MNCEYNPNDKDNLPSRKTIELFVAEQLERMRAAAMNKEDPNLAYQAALMDNNKYNLVTMTEIELMRSAEDSSRAVISLYQAFTNAWDKILRSFTKQEPTKETAFLESMRMMGTSLDQQKQLVDTQQKMYELNRRSTMALERIADALEYIRDHGIKQPSTVFIKYPERNDLRYG